MARALAVEILHHAGGVRSARRRQRLLLLELTRALRAYITFLLREPLLQLLRTCTGGAHQRPRLSELLAGPSGTLLCGREHSCRLLQARIVLRAQRLPLRKLGTQPGGTLLELGKALLDRGAPLLRSRSTLLGARGALCGCRL
jgi:hypothetical protein